MTINDTTIEHNALAPNNERHILTQFRAMWQVVIHLKKLMNAMELNQSETSLGEILLYHGINLNKQYKKFYAAALELTGKLVNPKLLDMAIENEIERLLDEEEKTNG